MACFGCLLHSLSFPRDVHIDLQMWCVSCSVFQTIPGSSLNLCHRLYKQYECVNVSVFGSWVVSSTSGTLLKAYELLNGIS